ncbi:MAG: hypothetical protein ACFFCB_02195 [Candidatus Odinarchaeota archaeon]
MTSPSPEIAKVKLGQYLQEADGLRAQNEYQNALIVVLVAGEFFWRKHQPTRAAGLLLEASDLFFMLQKYEASQGSLNTALELITTKTPLKWWEKELFGSIFLFTAALALIENSSSISHRLSDLRQSLSEKQQSQIRREDGYRVALALRKAVKQQVFSPIDDLDTKTTLRSHSDYTTLYEYLMGQAKRYVLIDKGLAALQHHIQQEDPE